MYPIAITICFYVQCRLLVFSNMRTTGSSSERLHTLAAMVDEGDMRALVRLRLFKYVCSRYVCVEYISIYMYMYIYLYTYIYRYIYMCVCRYIDIYACICICICVVCVCVCVCCT